MTRCERCNDLLEVTGHTNVDDPDKQTVETQTCISCGWSKRVRL